MPSAANHRPVESPLVWTGAMDKNYRRMLLIPLRKDKCAGQGYVAAGKVHCFFSGRAFLRGPLDQSTLSAGHSRKDDEKDEASE